jgi:hypothetical protein
MESGNVPFDRRRSTGSYLKTIRESRAALSLLSPVFFPGIKKGIQQFKSGIQTTFHSRSSQAARKLHTLRIRLGIKLLPCSFSSIIQSALLQGVLWC